MHEKIFFERNLYINNSHIFVLNKRLRGIEKLVDGGTRGYLIGQKGHTKATIISRSFWTTKSNFFTIPTNSVQDVYLRV